MKPSAERRVTGFTLVEVLVALVIMAVLAGLAWQGVNGMLRSREATSESIERSTRLNTVIAQWERDLESLYGVPDMRTLECSAQSLRLTRHGKDGIVLVVWSLRGSTLKRWASPTIQLRDDLEQRWMRIPDMLGNEAGHVTALEGVEEFRPIFLDDNGAEYNCQSERAPGELPQAIDLRLTVHGQMLRRVVAVVPLG